MLQGLQLLVLVVVVDYTSVVVALELCLRSPYVVVLHLHSLAIPSPTEHQRGYTHGLEGSGTRALGILGRAKTVQNELLV